MEFVIFVLFKSKQLSLDHIEFFLFHWQLHLFTLRLIFSFYHRSLITLISSELPNEIKDANFQSLENALFLLSHSNICQSRFFV